MLYLTSENQKRAFLQQAKQLIANGQKDFIKRTYVHPSGKRVKWMEALLDIGLTSPNQVWDEILTLTPNDYFSGPSVDVDRPNEGSVLWIFKKEVNGKIVYIKMKIDQRGTVCISFHEDW